jgi:hypothetical protein
MNFLEFVQGAISIMDYQLEIEFSALLIPVVSRKLIDLFSPKDLLQHL